MKARTTFIGACLVVAGLIFCGKDNIAGNSSQDGNVRGRLAKADGTPAAGVTVRFFPVDNAPRQVAKRMAGMDLSAEALAKADSVTTDSDGNFGIDLDSGTYNMLAATDSTAAFTDSVTAGVDTAIVDTMKTPGSLRAKVQLQGSDDPRTVFVLVMGTNIWAGPDAAGDFSLDKMAEGTYNVRILTTLDLYEPLDTMLLVRSAAADTLAEPIQLKYTGIPVPTGLKISYDTLKQIVTLTWDKPTTGRTVASYTIYRKRSDSTTTAILASGVTDTVYHDSTGVQDKMYEYRVAAVDTQGSEGVRSLADSVSIMGPYAIADTVLSVGGYGTLYAVELDKEGNFVVVNSTAHQSSPARVVRYDSSGTQINTWAITGGVEPSYTYHNIAIDDSGFIYIADGGNRVTKYDTAGNQMHQFQFHGAIRGFAIFRDTLYIGDRDAHAISAYTIDGDSLFTWGTDGPGNGQFKNIISIRADSTGAIFVEDAYDYGRIQIFVKDGTFRSSFDFRAFALAGGVLDLNAAQIDIRGNLVLATGQAHNFYGFDTSGNFIFRGRGIPLLNRAFFDNQGRIMGATWSGQILRIEK